MLPDKGAQSVASIDVFVPYEPRGIPEGYSEEDLAVLVYDYAQKQWGGVPSENTGDNTLKISTSLISAYAVVLEVDEPPDENGDDPHEPEDPEDEKSSSSSSSSSTCFINTLK